jgi:hypothetical protein
MEKTLKQREHILKTASKLFSVNILMRLGQDSFDGSRAGLSIWDR